MFSPKMILTWSSREHLRAFVWKSDFKALFQSCKYLNFVDVFIHFYTVGVRYRLRWPLVIMKALKNDPEKAW